MIDEKLYTNNAREKKLQKAKAEYWKRKKTENIERYRKMIERSNKYAGKHVD